MRVTTFRFARIFICFAVAAMFLSGCSSSDNHTDELSTSSVYGGSMPKGDYVTAEINGSAITIKNLTSATETTLSFSDPPDDVPDIGTSIIKVTETDSEGNCYLMALADNEVLGLLKMDADLVPLSGELPIYLFAKAELTPAELKGRSFNFMELLTDSEVGTVLEIGMVGFDTDDAGRLYGAAYDSGADGLFSITDEDGQPDSGDEFYLDLTETHSDGSLVVWENGVDNWNAATTLTGSTSGPLVLDHGPDAGGGAGFALPQVTETDPDAFWETVAGDYFLMAYVDTGIQAAAGHYRCTVRQNSAGQWDGQLALYDLHNLETPMVTIPAIVPLSQDIADEIDDYAAFTQAQSLTVQDTSLGRGVFQESGANPDYFITFDPNGNYILGIKLGAEDGITGYGLAVRDRNWAVP
ncbi:MAG: hypothetical protein P8X55_01585 [Desulfosarcinaceae bacterium]